MSGKGTLFCGLIHMSNKTGGWSQQRPVFNPGLGGLAMRGVLLIGRSASQCPDTSGHLCTVDRVFQGVVPSRGVMAVELGFLSEHMTKSGLLESSACLCS